MTDRDPELDPRPGDIWCKDGRYFMVHVVLGVEVYGSIVDPGQQHIPFGGVRVGLSEFPAKVEGAEYLDLTAEEWARLGHDPA